MGGGIEKRPGLSLLFNQESTPTQVNITITDTASILETQPLTARLDALLDALSTIVESIAVQVQASNTDSASILESLLVQVQTTISELASISETQLLTAQLDSILDSLSTVESILLEVQTTITESASISESIPIEVRASLAEVASILESIAIQAEFTISDQASISEQIHAIEQKPLGGHERRKRRRTYQYQYIQNLYEFRALANVIATVELESFSDLFIPRFEPTIGNLLATRSIPIESGITNTFAESALANTAVSNLQRSLASLFSVTETLAEGTLHTSVPYSDLRKSLLVLLAIRAEKESQRVPIIVMEGKRRMRK